MSSTTNGATKAQQYGSNSSSKGPTRNGLNRSGKADTTRQNQTRRRRQLAALLLAAGAPVKAVAKRVGVTRQQVHVWLKDEAFQDVLAEHERQHLDAIARELRGAKLAAVRTLRALLRDASVPAAQRIKAAESLLGAAVPEYGPIDPPGWEGFDIEACKDMSQLDAYIQALDRQIRRRRR